MTEVGNLVLVIKLGEPLYIGDVVVTILGQNSPTKFRVAVEAPKSVKILREGLIR